eukprot:10421343-Heterocapsa_arctica.AAC.1
MPCYAIIPTVSGVATPDPGLTPCKRKVRFDDNVSIEEVVTDTPFKDYSYAIKTMRTKAPRPVILDPNTMYARDLMSRAVARFRAIDLANGRGLVNDPEDTELWLGVES